MPRTPLAPGTIGNIRVRKLDHCWESTAAFCDSFGHKGRFRKRASTRQGALDRLNEAADLLYQEAALSGVVDDTAGFDTLVRVWMAELRATGTCLPETVEKYERMLADTREAFGHLRARDIRTPRVEAHLRSQPTISKRRKLRALLVRVFDSGMRLGIVASNPATATSIPPLPPREIREFPAENLPELWQSIATVRAAGRSGPAVCPDLEDIVAVMLGTSLRISEVLGLLWDDFDLSGDRPILRLGGQATWTRGKGTYRRNAKTRASHRTMVIPQSLAALLRRRKMAQPPNELGAVFVTRNGTFYQRSNIERSWRRLRELAEVDGGNFHSFRKTVATQIDAVLGADAAADQLGHTSKDITEKHYINRAPRVIDYAQVIEEHLGGRLHAAEEG